MKLHADRLEGVNAVFGHGPGEISVNNTVFRHSVIVPWKGDIVAWDADTFEALTPAHFQRIADLKPELVIFGSGPRIRFPAPSLLRPLIERGVGLETMDTGAACRTYNVLAAEGRSVVLAALLPSTTPPGP
ncbi:Mth938-like domain-containing protein [Piscinibacter gummiphilus]|uniref:Uncharacterized protein n=1 Tax=Piscinibacter gummiphilus TaxID=946333 RepID=A0A1W6LAK5_9BURK|nr:Mth938-like domain-containing protein [Piscinibacter gummiphilus]ARN21227.1 hypothetical protein A4W93_15720 [Piscinibacter gummiphilus]ATU65910.1 hypothetical protein CPZ87_15800 [Piscinibacter gummiphilus]GLS93789.1 hypothetical protein GCM10007918_10800 [Piscinibacter gummiphilus]